jgi:hypothetical protein
MKLTWKVLFLLSISTCSLNSYSEPLVAGKYESLDGQFQHDFKVSGDYRGLAKHSGKDYSGIGLYEQGSEICWFPNKDGTKGSTGNIVLYIGEAQCCLEFRQISGKFAVSKIWVKGTGAGYALCSNQVLRKSK